MSDRYNLHSLSNNQKPFNTAYQVPSKLLTPTRKRHPENEVDSIKSTAQILRKIPFIFHAFPTARAAATLKLCGAGIEIYRRNYYFALFERRPKKTEAERERTT